MTGLDGQHRGILLPRSAHRGPAEVGEELRAGHVRLVGCLFQRGHVEEAEGTVEEKAVAVLPALHLRHVPQACPALHAQCVKQHERAFGRDVLVAVAEVQAVEHAGARIADMGKVVGHLV